MIAAVQLTPVPAWSETWRDAEVVDAVLVDEPAPVGTATAGDAGLYDGSGRPVGAGRFGRLVSVLA